MSALGANRWLLSLHHDRAVLGSARELLLIFEDTTLLGANKLAMDEFSLTCGHFGALNIDTLFPALMCAQVKPSRTPAITAAITPDRHCPLAVIAGAVRRNHRMR